MGINEWHLLEDSYSKASHSSNHHLSKGTKGLSPRWSFQGCLYSKSPWQLEKVSLSGAKATFAYSLERCRISFPEQWTDMLTAQYEVWFPKNETSFLQSTVCSHVSWPSLYHPVEIEVWRTSVKRIIVWLLLLLWVINFLLFLTQGFHVSCQHPWNCGQWTDWLTC